MSDDLSGDMLAPSWPNLVVLKKQHFAVFMGESLSPPVLYNFGKRFMGWTLHMIMCVLLCYPVSIHMSELLSTGCPISSLMFQKITLLSYVSVVINCIHRMHPVDTMVFAGYAAAAAVCR